MCFFVLSSTRMWGIFIISWTGGSRETMSLCDCGCLDALVLSVSERRTMEMGAAAVAERTTKGVGQKLLKHAQTTRLREARESTKMYSCGGDTRTALLYLRIEWQERQRRTHRSSFRKGQARLQALECFRSASRASLIFSWRARGEWMRPSNSAVSCEG